MLEFKEIEFSDKDRIEAALKASDFMGCEYSFANNMAWRRLADSKICFYKDFYIVCAFGGETPVFVFPSGSGNIAEIITEMKLFSDSFGCPLTICGVTENSLNMLSELFPDMFTAELDRDGCDYIYLQKDLAELPGKKFHGKRNHLAKFNKLDYVYSPITENDLDDCILFVTEKFNEESPEDHSSLAEQFAMNTYFSHFSRLGLSGGIIRIGGKIAALTVGERLNSNTFCVHIEKADRSFDGIYAAINNLFARSAMNGFTYVNREEDLGIEGLRKAKLSYHPAFLLKKYIVTFN